MDVYYIQLYTQRERDGYHIGVYTYVCVCVCVFTLVHVYNPIGILHSIYVGLYRDISSIYIYPFERGQKRHKKINDMLFISMACADRVCYAQT